MKYINYLSAIMLLIPGACFGQFLFQDETSAAGINMHSTGATLAGAGVVVFDLDGDGWDDLYMAGGFDSDRIFKNMGDGTFKDFATPDLACHSAPCFRTY